MPKYNCSILVSKTYQVEIEADNEEEARDKADSMQTLEIYRLADPDNIETECVDSYELFEDH